MREEQAMEENPYQVHVDEFFRSAAVINETLLPYGIDLFAESDEPPPPPRDRQMRKVSFEIKKEWIGMLRDLDDFYPSEPDFHPHEEANDLEAHLKLDEVLRAARDAFKKAFETFEARMKETEERLRADEINRLQAAKRHARELGASLDPEARDLVRKLRGTRGRGRRR